MGPGARPVWPREALLRWLRTQGCPETCRPQSRRSSSGAPKPPSEKPRQQPGVSCKTQPFVCLSVCLSASCHGHFAPEPLLHLIHLHAKGPRAAWDRGWKHPGQCSRALVGVRKENRHSSKRTEDSPALDLVLTRSPVDPTQRQGWRLCSGRRPRVLRVPTGQRQHLCLGTRTGQSPVMRRGGTAPWRARCRCGWNGAPDTSGLQATPRRPTSPRQALHGEGSRPFVCCPQEGVSCGLPPHPGDPQVGPSPHATRPRPPGHVVVCLC